MDVSTFGIGGNYHDLDLSPGAFPDLSVDTVTGAEHSVILSAGSMPLSSSSYADYAYSPTSPMSSVLHGFDHHGGYGSTVSSSNAVTPTPFSHDMSQVHDDIFQMEACTSVY
jgi:hypothetical protein